MSLRALSGVVSTRALVSGRIRDSLTGGSPPRISGLTLSMRPTEAAAYSPFPGSIRLLDGMHFTTWGSPERLFPAGPPSGGLDLRLEVEAPGYAPEAVEFSVPAAHLVPVDEVVRVGHREVRVNGFPHLPRFIEVALTPLPVALAGWVIDDHDPEAPVPGATVRVTAPAPRGPVTTDARGYFRIQDLPVALSVTVEIRQGSRSLVQEVALRPSDPLNEWTFSLPA